MHRPVFFFRNWVLYVRVFAPRCRSDTELPVDSQSVGVNEMEVLFITLRVLNQHVSSSTLFFVLSVSSQSVLVHVPPPPWPRPSPQVSLISKSVLSPLCPPHPVGSWSWSSLFVVGLLCVYLEPSLYHRPNLESKSFGQLQADI